jgi:hypothetical protein
MEQHRSEVELGGSKSIKAPRARSHGLCQTFLETVAYVSLGNFANRSHRQSIGAAIKPATVSNAGLSRASG